MKKLNLEVLLNEEIEYISKNYDMNPPKQSSPIKLNQTLNNCENEGKTENKKDEDQVPLTQNFDIISQLIGNISTQKANTQLQKPEDTAHLNQIMAKKLNNLSSNTDFARKRNINETQSPASKSSENEPKKSKLCSQTIRNLNKFAFVENEDIPKKSDKSVFAVPLAPQSIMNNTQIIESSQSISKSQRSQSKVQFSQKTLSSINDDDLNFDI